jgi:uncharacterized PurR-regulated membrane protein YhhQ (DUF165 family)
MARPSTETKLVFAFLAAIVVANVAVATYGQAALVVTAWILIPFDMVTRDLLHERWRGRSLHARMFALVCAGALITAAVSSPQVALASVCAFSAAMLTNGVVYEAVADRTGRFARMNISNFFASGVDSIIFPIVAFAMVNPWLSAAQAASKFLGGLIWTTIVLRFRKDTPNVPND